MLKRIIISASLLFTPSRAMTDDIMQRYFNKHLSEVEPEDSLVLSLDGGGVRGAFQARILQKIEEEIEPRGLHHVFDLMCGTSIGGVHALALASGVSAYSINQLYNEETISKILKFHGYSRGILSYKYDNSYLESFFEQQFKELYPSFSGPFMLEHLQTNAFVTIYDTMDGKLKSLKSWKKKYKKISVIDAALGTSAAPTYFPPRLIKKNAQTTNHRDDTICAIDGGVGANNPSHNAYVQSRDLFGDHVRPYILSIGTGEASHPISFEKVSSLGVMGWATEILNIIMKAQSTNTENLMSELSEDNLIGYQRLQGNLPRENYQLDRRDQENLNVLKTAANKLIDSEIFDFTVDELKNIYHVDDDSFDLKSPQLEEDIINSTRLAIEKRNSQKYERPNL